MQIFKTMLKVIRKWLPSAMTYIIVFIIVSVFASNASTKENVFEVTKLNVCVFDEDDTPESRALIKSIGKNNKIVELEEDKDMIIDALYYGRVNYALIINKGYAEKMAAGDTSDLFGSYHMDENFSTVYMKQFLEEYTSSVRAYLTMGKSLSEAIECTDEALSQGTEVAMFRDDNEGNKHFSVGFSGYFQYMPYILISAVLIVVCQVLVVMNRKDIRFRTNCSCIKNTAFSFQLFLGSVIFVMAVWFLLIVVGAILNKEMYTGRAWLAVLNSLILAINIAAIALFISSFEPKANVLNLITQVISLGMCFTCGVFIPTNLLGDNVLAVARFLPVYWYIKANSMIAETEPYSLNGVLQCYGIQLAFAAAFVVLTLLVRRVKYSGAAIGTSVKKIAASD